MYDERKPWRAVIAYRMSAYLVGYFDSEETAKMEAALKARCRSQEPVMHLDVDEENGPRYRQYWRGRWPLSEWVKR